MSEMYFFLRKNGNTRVSHRVQSAWRARGQRTQMHTQRIQCDERVRTSNTVNQKKKNENSIQADFALFRHTHDFRKYIMN